MPVTTSPNPVERMVGFITRPPAEKRAVPAPPKRRSINEVFTLSEPTGAQIRERAYYIYLARAGKPGTPEQDWLQAERELREEMGLPPRKS